MVKQFNLPFFHFGFAICLLLVGAVTVFSAARNRLILQPLHKIMLVSWIGYLISLLFATLQSASTYSLFQWGILFSKFLFFVFLLLYLKADYIVITLRAYANLMVATVCFALVAIIFLATGVPPLTTIDLGGKIGDVYFGAYYVHNYNDLICLPTSSFSISGLNPIFRIQGLSEEPGTYAFALLPAFFWFLIVEKAFVRSLIILLGLMFSFSLGAGLFLFILLPLIARKYSANYAIPAFFLGAVSVIGVMSTISGYCIAQHQSAEKSTSSPAMMMPPNVVGELKIKPVLAEKDNFLAPNELRINVITEKSPVSSPHIESKSLTTLDETESKQNIKEDFSPLSKEIQLKKSSFQDRWNGLRAVLGYFKDHFIGTGTALGMLTVNNSISIGYAVAILESGIVGGFFYLCFFAIMSFLTLKTIITVQLDSFDSEIKFVVALSVTTVLVMGLQRMQPDLSFWHMWIYAIWFYLQQIKPDMQKTSKKHCFYAKKISVIS
jgi:hypothetical protein